MIDVPQLLHYGQCHLGTLLRGTDVGLDECHGIFAAEDGVEGGEEGLVGVYILAVLEHVDVGRVVVGVE